MRQLHVLFRIGIALGVATAAFLGAIYVQDLVEGDLRLPMQCVDKRGQVVGCPQPAPNLWAASAIAAIIGVAAYWIQRPVRNDPRLRAFSTPAQSSIAPTLSRAMNNRPSPVTPAPPAHRNAPVCSLISPVSRSSKAGSRGLASLGASGQPDVKE